MGVHKVFNNFMTLAKKLQESDRHWEYTEEPHASRRKAILKAHPEIKELMGPDPVIVLVVVFSVSLQITMCHLLQGASWWVIVLCAYVIGGTVNHGLIVAIHECAHNLAFGHNHVIWNRLLGYIANIPIGAPMSVTYKNYHLLHHKFLGHPIADVDIPMPVEAIMFTGALGKILWLIVHPIIYLIRPFCKQPIPIGPLERINVVTQMVATVLLIHAFGCIPVSYFLLSSFFGVGLHPMTGRVISEHFIFDDSQATHSYYGPWNVFLLNIGYHVEHHDFPYIPFLKLPQVRKIAPEFYTGLKHHNSLLKLLWNFVWEEKQGPHSRGVYGFLDEMNSGDKVPDHGI